MIRFDAHRQLFLLETERTHYAFFLRREQLITGYWGEKLRCTGDIPEPCDYVTDLIGREYLTNNALYNNEYPGWGSRYFDTPALKLTFHDGVRDVELRYTSHSIDGNTLRITLTDRVYALDAELCYRIYDGLDVIDRSCTVTNRTGRPVTLYSVASAAVNFPYREQPYRLTHMGSAWGTEYQLTRTPLTRAATVLESLGGLSNTNNLPYFALDDGSATENSGAVWFGALQWSGNFKITAQVDTKRIPHITGGIHDQDFSYMLPAGESFTAPVFTLGYSGEGFSGASRQLHDYIRSVQEGPWKNKCLPVIYNSWTSFLFDIDEAKLMELATNAARLGVELFVVDDGWFSTRDDNAHGLGDWEPSETKFPRGLAPLIRHVNDLGMLFGIWVEPEMVNPGTRLYARHPDWVLHFPTRQREESRNQLILNLAREDVYEYIVSFLEDLLEKHNIAYLKWDMNRWFSQPGWPELPAGEQQSLWVRYVWNLHRIFRHIHTKFPHVILENCASGGLRSDLAMSRWCSRMNRSDNQDPVDELLLHEGFTYLQLPRSAGGAGHISASGTGFNKRACPMEFKAHIGMMGSLGIGIDLTGLTPEEYEELKGYIALNKQIRHIVQLGDLYRLASLRETDHAAFQFVSKDKKEALVFLFGPSRTFKLPYGNLVLYGLDPQKRYDVNGEFTMTGHGLMTVGIPGGCHTVGTLKSKLFRIQEVAL